jgi:uncharacterized membrane protein
MSAMTSFALALGFFIFIHSGLSATRLRTVAVRAVGEPIYRGLFSIASLAGIIAVGATFGEARLSPDNAPLWDAPSFGRHLAHTLTLLGFLLGMSGLLTPGPTSVGFEGAIAKAEPATGVLRITRHPFLWGVALWGLGHLAANPEPVSIALFGGLAAMSMLGARSIDRKTKARTPEHWERFSAITSNIPFAAIVQRRNRLAINEIWWKVLIAAAAYAAVAYFHASLFGVPAFT